MEPAGPCPKCGGFSWYETDTNGGIVQRCHCGLCRFMEQTKNGMVIYHAAKVSDVVLPKSGTKLSKCLGIITAQHPDPVQTKVVAIALDETCGDIAPHIMVLMYRGLLEKVIEGRGVVGGSYWKLTNRAVELLKL